MDGITKYLTMKLEKTQSLSDGWYFAEIALPIKKIDGMKCFSGIVLSRSKKNQKRYRLSFSVSIGPTGAYSNGELEVFHKLLGVREFLVKDELNAWMTEKIALLQKIISTLRISPRRNQLTEHFEKEEFIWNAQKTFCSNLGETVDLNYGECSVCAEPTTLKTTCAHYLCVCCLSNLRKPKCPMCRHDLYDDDDDDDASDDEDYNAGDDEDGDEDGDDDDDEDGDDEDGDDDDYEENTAAAADVVVDNMLSAVVADDNNEVVEELVFRGSIQTYPYTRHGILSYDILSSGNIRAL